jgi:mono/diheme cytochrome c family protein
MDTARNKRCSSGENNEKVDMKRVALEFMFSVVLASMALDAQGVDRTAQLPDAPGRETVRKICAACHPAELVLGKGMSREQWGGIVSNMISRGAKGTEAEFAEVVDYLAKNLPPHTDAQATTRRRGGGGGGLLAQAGPSDKHIVDEQAAQRGKATYTAECITCHGPKARGTDKGPDIVRSLIVLKDRYGDTIGPFLRKGHPAQSGASSADLKQTEIVDLSHFLHQQVGDTLRTGPYNKVLNVLTGDPKAGEAYFNGLGKCNTCHSPTGDLAGIAKKYDPPVLQLKFVFPQTVAFGRSVTMGARKPVMVTVTSPSGERVTGVLDQMDDFSVSLRDASGQYWSFKRAPDVRVEKSDPYAAHVALLDQYTDKDIHDVVAYLETLK